MSENRSSNGLVRKSLGLDAELRRTVEAEMAERVALHKTRMTQYRHSAQALRAAAKDAALPLVLLAQGDSWFDYPLDGNSISLSDTDIIAQLRTMGTQNPIILNIAHFGETSVQEMALPKKRRMIEALGDAGNWGEQGTPDAILFSAGGNDIAGTQFTIFLDDKADHADGLDTQRFDEALGMIEASYRDLFEFRDHYAQGVPIFAHCYDFPIPNGKHPPCIGPWLQPSLRYAHWYDIAEGTKICRDALLGFRSRLKTLASDPSNLFFLIDTQATLRPTDWANELHPFPPGFKALAEKFVGSLRAQFAGRI